MSDLRAGPRVKAEEIRRLHRQKMADGTITSEQAELIFWLYCHAQDNKLTNAEVGELINLDGSNVTRVYKLTYNDGNLKDDIYHAIERVKADMAVELERMLYGKAGFVETSLAKAVFELCHACRRAQEISQLWGESQTGKSEALKRYTHLNNSGRTRYIELKSGLGYSQFMRYLAECVGAPTYGSMNAVRANINGQINHNTLLIFDELHKPLLTAELKTKIKIMDAIRDINDDVGCGIVLCGTNTLRDEITRGSIKDVLKQLQKRGVIKVQCPDVLPMSDVWLFAESYGLSRPATKTPEYDLCARINRINGIGMFTKFLKAGAMLAGNQKARYTWNHFIRSHDIITKRNQVGWWDK